MSETDNLNIENCQSVSEQRDVMTTCETDRSRLRAQMISMQIPKATTASESPRAGAELQTAAPALKDTLTTADSALRPPKFPKSDWRGRVAHRSLSQAAGVGSELDGAKQSQGNRVSILMSRKS